MQNPGGPCLVRLCHASCAKAVWELLNKSSGLVTDKRWGAKCPMGAMTSSVFDVMTTFDFSSDESHHGSVRFLANLILCPPPNPRKRAKVRTRTNVVFYREPSCVDLDSIQHTPSACRQTYPRLYKANIAPKLSLRRPFRSGGCIVLSSRHGANTDATRPHTGIHDGDAMRGLRSASGATVETHPRKSARGRW